jgi:hypothetical protein
MSVSMEQLVFHWTDFYKKFVFEYFFSKIFRETTSFIEFVQKVLHVKNNTHVSSYLAQFVLEWEKFQTIIVKKIEAHILCSHFFRKSCPFME